MKRREPTEATPPTLDLAALIARYDAFLLDAYGVLVDGSGPLDGALELLEAIRAAGKRLLVVSNDASRLPPTTVARYRRYGLPIAESEVLTSGMLLGPHFEREGLVGQAAIVLGPEDSREMVRRAGVVVTEPTDRQASIVVAADDDGYPFLEAIEDTLSTLMHRLDHGRPTALVLPNPDLIYPKRRGAYGLTSGMVARILEQAVAVRHPEAAARFTPLGKPHRPMYAEACSRLGDIARDRLVMIGDQLATDIQGANDFGIDSVLVGTGLTSHEALQRSAVRPTWWLPALR